jgi:DNA helicase II / ATP-dependent DNA helicase PcrA
MDGQGSTLIALADAEQRIYDFRGADPARISQYIERFEPQVFDFGNENYRSDGTDITTFGNDLLRGANRGRTYTNVVVKPYTYYKPDPILPAKLAVLKARKRLMESENPEWSLGVLVSSKKMMLQVSACLSSDNPAEIFHTVHIDPEGPAIAAVSMGGLLEGANSTQALADKLLADVIAHIRGRNGGEISAQDLALATALEAYLSKRTLNGTRRRELLANVNDIAAARMALELSGDPEADWLNVRRLIDDASHPKLISIAEVARYIRLLHRGTQLREGLAERWRLVGRYEGARNIVEAALLQEHFSAATRVLSGVNVMTIHKSKGKQFDEVILFEGIHHGRFVREDADTRDTERARLNLRVGVTRAKSKTLILTSEWKRCPLL